MTSKRLYGLELFLSSDDEISVNWDSPLKIVVRDFFYMCDLFSLKSQNKKETK